MSSHERQFDADGQVAEAEDPFADVSPAAVMALDDDDAAPATETDREVGALLADGLCEGQRTD